MGQDQTTSHGAVWSGSRLSAVETQNTGTSADDRADNLKSWIEGKMLNNINVKTVEN